MLPIEKDVASHFPQNEEAALQIALKYDLIYAQSGYAYTVLPDLPRPGGANALGASHATDGIVGALFNPYVQPPMGYGFSQGGASTSGNFPPPGSTYPRYDMPPLFSQPPIYYTATQTPFYLYPWPSAPAPPGLAPPPPLPSQPPQQQRPPPQGQVYAQQGATNPPPSKKKRKGNKKQSTPSNP